MKIYLVAKDGLEAQGIRWIIQSHVTGIQLTSFEEIKELSNVIKYEKPDFVIIDMDKWALKDDPLKEVLQTKQIRWLGISSERVFQVAYRGLSLHAEDILFRPFSPGDLIKQVQQLRFQIRNRKQFSAGSNEEENDHIDIDYADFFLNDKLHPQSVIMSAFITPNGHALPYVYETLQEFPFTGKYRFFALSQFILGIHETEEQSHLKEQCRAFLASWKEQMEEPLALVLNSPAGKSTLKEIYRQTKELTEQVFFEGYDIILAGDERAGWRDMDPFLTPLEQRQWIEMLEKRDTKAICEWVEHEFFTYKKPYPSPDMVRIRLTSVLAQIRRYMKAYKTNEADWEIAYHNVFQQIIRNPVIYQIVSELLTFVTHLLAARNDSHQKGTETLVEKVKDMMEANFWDAQWNLAACAQALRINKSTLSRRFAAESGQSFRDTLHQMRIREAKRLLQDTELSIEEISRLTGYTHQTYFNTKFKQLEGCTPFAYRSGIE
ncbi:response regulator transcription factor [uncultured Metabacillus sp.]|uniref:response regulator transcription factor n=1 Tax=uncultured Metabacillus sp. TaxID=2860135 RepID=UPI0026173B87|nr:response regulator transcription factor [uncultured Metabacillus sp.]